MVEESQSLHNIMSSFYMYRTVLFFIYTSSFCYNHQHGFLLNDYHNTIINQLKVFNELPTFKAHKCTHSLDSCSASITLYLLNWFFFFCPSVYHSILFVIFQSTHPVLHCFNFSFINNLVSLESLVPSLPTSSSRLFKQLKSL